MIAEAEKATDGILREEFLVPLKLTPYAIAAALNVPRTRIERIAREEKPVTANTALQLGKFFKTGAAFWMNIQTRFDLETAVGVIIDTHEHTGMAEILMKREHRVRWYALGEKITFNSAEFGEIAFACNMFASGLASKLPTLPAVAVPSTTGAIAAQRLPEPAERQRNLPRRTALPCFDQTIAQKQSRHHAAHRRCASRAYNAASMPRAGNEGGNAPGRLRR